ncbi:MAG: hypothetical protein K6F37_09430 [Lachnospiraceae bacterium]|nr:hypothetical protein [Lachnospiraceae bacterium]
MKKIPTKLLGLMTMLFALALICVPAVPTKAAEVYYNSYSYPVTDSEGNTTYQEVSNKKFFMETYSQSTFSIEINNSSAVLKDLKSSSKDLKLKKTYTNNYTCTGYTSDTDPSYSSYHISLYSKKPGNYKVTFSVDGKKYTLNVRVVDNSNHIKSIKFGSKTIETYSITNDGDGYTYSNTYNYNVSGKSGKLTVSTNSNYKITGLVVASTNKKGEYTYKAYKNGKKITLSKSKYSYKSEDGNYTYNAPKKYTHVYVSYKNTYTGFAYTYSVGKDENGKPAVKYVMTYPNKKQSNPDFYTNGNGSTFTLIQ